MRSTKSTASAKNAASRVLNQLMNDLEREEESGEPAEIETEDLPAEAVDLPQAAALMALVRP